MDQAASPDQGLLWYLRERGESPDMDRCLCLRPGRYYQEANETETESLHNSTNLESVTFRENPHRASVFAAPEESIEGGSR